MNRRLSLFVLLASALTFLASLFLSCVHPSYGHDGWGTYGEVAALVALALAAGAGASDDELVVLALALLVVTVLDLILIRRAFGTINWEGWVSVGLCLLLAALGWLERNGGLENFRLPEEIWRVDRLPGEN